MPSERYYYFYFIRIVCSYKVDISYIGYPSLFILLTALSVASMLVLYLAIGYYCLFYSIKTMIPHVLKMKIHHTCIGSVITAQHVRSLCARRHCLGAEIPSV